MNKIWRYINIIVIVCSIAWLCYKLYSDWTLIIDGLFRACRMPLIATTTLILTILGILTDALRWKVATGDTDNWHIKQHVITVITSITYSNFSLFGIGEHVARINTKADNKSGKTILSDSLLISTLNTIVIPCLTIPFVAYNNLPIIQQNTVKTAVIAIIILAAIIVAATFIKSKWTEDFHFKNIIPTLLLTILKTYLFFLQFYIILNGLITSLAPGVLWSITCTYYLIITLIPFSTGISNVAVRTGVINILFTDIVDSASGISAVIIMWFFNIALISLTYIICKSLFLHKGGNQDNNYLCFRKKSENK
ncbi:MAG: hypothetical protein HUJ96_00255 [Marinilabiliaceae bacterium]|nr:hypothetical protein [Marinilabiliaceae bacterium]